MKLLKTISAKIQTLMNSDKTEIIYPRTVSDAIYDFHHSMYQSNLNSAASISLSKTDFDNIDKSILPNGKMVIINDDEENHYFYKWNSESNELEKLFFPIRYQPSEEIYLSEDIKVQIKNDLGGLANNQIITSGTTLTDIIKTLLTKEYLPNVDKPNLIMQIDLDNFEFECGEEIKPTITVFFEEGAYEYGPPTTVEVESFKLNMENNSDDEITLIDNINLSPWKSENSITIPVGLISFKSILTHSGGSNPLTNLGSEKENLSIKSNTLYKEINIYGYRKLFYGISDLTEFEPKTSHEIRNLKYSLLNPTVGKTFIIQITEKEKFIIIAIPSYVPAIRSIIQESSNLNIIKKFSKKTISVEGANQYNAINYTIYYMLNTDIDINDVLFIKI